MTHKKRSLRAIVQSLGLVFGDIGTSPIYTLTVIFLLTPKTEENVIGVLSLIVWTLITLVTIVVIVGSSPAPGGLEDRPTSGPGGHHQKGCQTAEVRRQSRGEAALEPR